MSDSLISTRSHGNTCRRCGAALLIAYDQGLPAIVDAKPIPTPQAEIAILLQNRRTYTCTRYSRELIHRTPERIRGGFLQGTIHAEHKCDPRAQFATARYYGKQARHHARLRTKEQETTE